jgi:hypothetical protein
LLPTFSVDAANVGSGFQVGIHSTLLGARVITLDSWISSQQQAELSGLLAVLEIALHLGLPCVTVQGDNLASLFSLRRLRPFYGNVRLARAMRAVFNFMWERHLGVHLVWVPSALQPADPLSRLTVWSKEAVSQAVLDVNLRRDTLSQFPQLTRFLGFLHL